MLSVLVSFLSKFNKYLSRGGGELGDCRVRDGIYIYIFFWGGVGGGGGGGEEVSSVPGFQGIKYQYKTALLGIW